MYINNAWQSRTVQWYLNIVIDSFALLFHFAYASMEGRVATETKGLIWHCLNSILNERLVIFNSVSDLSDLKNTLLQLLCYNRNNLPITINLSVV